MRLLAIALLVQPRIRVGGRFMGIVRALLAVEVFAVAARMPDFRFIVERILPGACWSRV